MRRRRSIHGTSLGVLRAHAEGEGLENGVAMVETNVGRGRLFLIAPEILFRSQPHGNYKLFFNGLYLSVTPSMTAGQ